MRAFTGDRIILASHNKGKLREMSALLGPYGVEVISAGDLGFDEPEETESTFAGNARIKAHYAAKKSGLPALSDDSGLMVDALGGDPGVYTADWAETPNGRDFSMAMEKVWSLLEANDAPTPRTAHFCSTLCLAWPDGHDEMFEGTVDGTLTWPMRGDRGFGFDPMFVPLGHDMTFAEMDLKHKQEMSHRTVAFTKLLAGPFKDLKA
jgi:XTP/dITP diphosphohydrolase